MLCNGIDVIIQIVQVDPQKILDQVIVFIILCIQILLTVVVDGNQLCNHIDELLDEIVVACLHEIGMVEQIMNLIYVWVYDNIIIVQVVNIKLLH